MLIVEFCGALGVIEVAVKTVGLPGDHHRRCPNRLGICAPRSLSLEPHLKGLGREVCRAQSAAWSDD